MTQPNPLPPTVAELRDTVMRATCPCWTTDARNALDELCRRAADPAPVADEAAIECWMRRFEAQSFDVNTSAFDELRDEAVRLMRAAPRNDDKLRKLREEADLWRCRHASLGSEPAFIRKGMCEMFICEIDKLLAESPAGDAGEPSCKREYDAMVKLIRDSHNGYDPAARKELGMEEPASAIVALHDLIKEQKSLEGYEVRDLRREVDDLRARLQAAEAELDEKAELLDKVIYDAEEFSGKLSDILDKNLVPDGEPLARVKEAIDMLTETILERDKLEAERDKLAADLAAAQKERDAIEQRETKGVALFDQIVAELRRDLAAAKAEGARAVVEELEGLAKVFEKNCADMRRNAMEQPTTALNGYDVQANVWMHACDAVSWRIAKLRAAQPQPTTAEPATTSDRTPKEGKQPIFWAPWRESGATVRQGDDRLSDRPACEEVVRTFNPVTATPSETWVYVQCRRALEGKP